MIYQNLRQSIFQKSLSSLRRQFLPFRWYVDYLHNGYKISLHPKFVIGVITETEHLIIRDFLNKDAVGLLEYLSHPRVNRFIDGRLCSVESALAYIFDSSKDVLRYAACLKEDDFIVDDAFTLREHTDTFGVGWHFNQRSESKGPAYGATTGLLDYLFHGNGARRIYGSAEDDNLRSKGLCEHLGMRHEGCMKEFVSFVRHPDGTSHYEDTCIYAILSKEWKSNRRR